MVLGTESEFTAHKIKSLNLYKKKKILVYWNSTYLVEYIEESLYPVSFIYTKFV